MKSGQRYDVRPNQRGHDGLLGLDARNPPSLGDTTLDQITVTVPGRFSLNDNRADAGKMLDHLKAMFERTNDIDPIWGVPTGRTPHSFRVVSAQEEGSTLGATLNATLSRPAVNLQLQFRINPTRTLRHRVPDMRGQTDPAGYLASLSPAAFFAKSNAVQQLQTFDGNDNAIVSYAEVRRLLGDDFSSTFVGVFDGQLRRWATLAINAPGAEFAVRETQDAIVAHGRDGTLQLAWPCLTIRSAEVYFERRHADAANLLARLTRDVEAGHVGAAWRRYGRNEIGQRLRGTEVVGLDLTQNIQQKYYAKTATRVRIETVYNRAIRSALRDTRGSASMTEFASLCEALRRDAIRRCQWDAFCDLCAEPARATLHEACNLFATIAEVANAEGADSAAITAKLLSTGGIDATVATERLAVRLIQRGVLEAKSLRRRNRPGAQIRYRLRSEWLEVANRIQSAFVDD